MDEPTEAVFCGYLAQQDHRGLARGDACRAFKALLTSQLPTRGRLIQVPIHSEGYTFVPAVAGVATAAKEGPSLFVFSGEALEINGFSADEDRQELDLLYIGDEEYELVEVDNAAAITGVAKDDALEIFVYKTEEDNTILAVEKSADSGVDGLTNITLVGVTEAVKFLGNLDDQFILIA